MTKDMGLEFLFGKMVRNILANGKMDFNKVKVN